MGYFAKRVKESLKKPAEQGMALKNKTREELAEMYTCRLIRNVTTEKQKLINELLLKVYHPSCDLKTSIWSKDNTRQYEYVLEDPELYGMFRLFIKGKSNHQPGFIDLIAEGYIQVIEFTAVDLSRLSEEMVKTIHNDLNQES